MILVTVMYPAGEAFDTDYYLKTHMQRADVLVREAVAAANKNFPQGRVLSGHRSLPESYSAA